MQIKLNMFDNLILYYCVHVRHFAARSTFIVACLNQILYSAQNSIITDAGFNSLKIHVLP